MHSRSLCAMRNTADSLSAEKREGTLGLLFLTDLRGYDVVLTPTQRAALPNAATLRKPYALADFIGLLQG